MGWQDDVNAQVARAKQAGSSPEAMAEYQRAGRPTTENAAQWGAGQAGVGQKVNTQESAWNNANNRSARENVNQIDPANIDRARQMGVATAFNPGAVNRGDATENGLWAQGRQQQNDAYQQAGGVAQMYRNQAQGLGQSAAQAQLQQGTDQGIAAQMAMANSARGGAQAMLAARTQAGQQGAQMQAASNQQAAVLRAQEQQQAMQGLSGAVGMQGQMAGQMRGQDAGLRGENMQFGLNERAQNIQVGNMNQGNQLAYEQMGNQMQGQNAGFRDAYAARQMQAAQAKEDRRVQETGSWLGAGASVVGGLLGAMSDIRMKENITPADQRGVAQMYAQAQGMKEASPSEAMLRQLRPYSYNYKPESGEDPNRRQFGIMAQDLERSDMGASLVHDTPKGKMIDAGKGVGVALAATSDLQKQIDELRAGVSQYGSNPPAVKGRY